VEEESRGRREPGKKRAGEEESRGTLIEVCFFSVLFVMKYVMSLLKATIQGFPLAVLNFAW
jgi:hypothetical protein